MFFETKSRSRSDSEVSSANSRASAGAPPRYNRPMIDWRLPLQLLNQITPVCLFALLAPVALINSHAVAEWKRESRVTSRQVRQLYADLRGEKACLLHPALEASGISTSLDIYRREERLEAEFIGVGPLCCTEACPSILSYICWWIMVGEQPNR